MKAKNPKCYVIMVAAKFPQHHPRAGRPTDFELLTCERIKIHTVRYGYDEWMRRAEKVSRGEAYISLRVWEGIPYGKGSTTREIMRLHTVSIQQIHVSLRHGALHIEADGSDISMHSSTLASNDGLSLMSLFNWLMPDRTVPFDGCIIHFTNFRY